jgi:hypothetical protein
LRDSFSASDALDLCRVFHRCLNLVNQIDVDKHRYSL